jgi:hypothetical protein
VEYLAAYAGPAGPGTMLGEGTTDLAAVVIGDSDNMAVVQGTPAELQAFAAAVTAAAERAAAMAAARERRIAVTIEAASQAFWNTVAAHWPEATTGDFPPDATLDWSRAAQAAVTVWVEGNVPPVGFVPQPSDEQLRAYVADMVDVDDERDHAETLLGEPTWPVGPLEHAEFGRWQYEVANGDTTLGFRDWLAD